MVCEYFVNGKYISESEFKQLLSEGLLDQLIATNKVENILDKLLDEAYINEAYKGVTVKNVTIPVSNKINRNYNTERFAQSPEMGQQWNINLTVPQKNPIQVLEESNKQIKAENKKRGEDRPTNKLILGIKVGEGVKFGKLSSELESEVSKSLTEGYVRKLEEGIVYMFVPSAYGYSAVRLFSNFLGQTKAAPSIKSKLKQFFEKDLGKEKEITDPYLNKLSYRTKFIKDEEGVKIITTTVGESTPKKVLYKTLEEFETVVLGKFDQKGKYIGETESKGIDGKFFNVKKEPGLLAFVDSEKINSGKYDIEITNNGFITTDAFTEAGNFFNSSSFQIKLSEITGLPEQIKKIKADPKAVKDVESEVENNVAKEEATATSPKNQDTKKEENPIYDEQLPQDVDDFNAVLAMGPEGVMFGKDNEPLGEKEEGVEDDDFFKYGNSDNSDFNIDNISPKTKVEDSGWSYQKQNKIDLEKELKYIEDKLGKELIATKTFKTIASIKKYLPEDVYKQLQEIGKNGKSIRGLYTDAAVFLSERAFEGTGYHEAFHVVFNLSLDLPQRFALLREAEEKFKSELSEDPSYLEIEELLADKFQEYVLRKGVEDKSLGARISRYFKALFRKLQVFFRPNSRIKLDKIFEDIDLGIYKNKKLSFINTDLSKIKPEYSKFKVESAFESVAMEADAIKTLKYKTVSIIDQLRETDKAEYEGLSDAEVINKIGLVAFYSQLIESLYDQGAAIQAQLQTAKQEGKEEQQKVLEAYFNNLKTLINAFTNKGNNLVVKETEEGKRIFYLKESTEFLKKFNRSLKEYNIKLRPTFAENTSTTDNLENPIDDIEDTSETLEERWDRAAGEFNPIETSSQYLKRKLATIPVRDGNKVLSNSFGTPTFYNSADVFNFLGKEITDQYTIEGLMEKLKSLESKKPFISNVIELINTDATFRSNLITDLAKKTFVKYTIIYEKDGDYEIIAANQEDFKSIVNQSVIGEFLVEENDLFNKYPKGHPKAGQRNFEDIDTDKVSLRVFELENLLNKIKNASPSNAKEVDSVLKELSETIAKSNINFSVEQLEMIWNPNRRGERASFANILDFTESLIGVFNALEKGDNPFLHLVEEEFIDNKNIKRERKVLERFVSNAFFAYQDQLVAAHRNADGKTVYSIQLSNYLNKQLSTFKNQKDFDNYFEKIKNDPLLSNLPFFKMITDENGKLLSDVTKNLEVTVIDALSRKGKNKAVSYNELSPIEMVSMQLALFHNNNKKKYARFTLPTPADSPTMPTIQFKRQSIEEVKDSFVQVALAEIGKINNLKSIPEDSPLRLVKNYYKKGTKFQILSFLNNRVDPDTVTTEELKEAISDFLENEFYEREINKYKKEGVILDYNKETGKIAFAEKVITKQRIANKETFFKEWVFSQYFMNTQMSTVFAGDPSFYKDTVDYQKRYKQIISPGTYTNTDNPDVKLNYSGYIFQDEFVPTSKENADYIIENVKNSNLSPNKKQELISLWTKLSDPKEEETNNVTDAATYVSLDRMIEVYESLGRMTKKHYEAAERIRKGIETPEDAGMFVITKPFQFTKVYIGGVEVPVQIKNSEFLLTKSFAERSPKLMKVYDLLNNPDNGVDFVAFESAVKVGGLANAVTKDGKPVYSTLELVDGNYQLSENANTITLSQEDWRLQQETPNKYQDKDGNYGSQLRVLMIADMNMEGDYVIGGKKMKGKEVAQLYQDLIVRNLQNSFEEVQRMFLNEDGETINYEVLVEHLRREAEDRNMEEDIYTALETIPDILNPGKQVPAIPLWHPAISYKMESLFNSFFKNRVTRQEINGGSLVDVTSYGVSDQLQYDAKTNTFQALMPLWTKKFFPKDENGKPDITKIPNELKKMIAYRIPTEDKYSIFNIEVVGFADSAAGGGIVLPVEATTLAGLDFDIDKLFLVAPSFYINKNGDPTLIKYIDKDSSSEDIVNSLINSSYSNLESFVNRRFKNEADEFLKLYQEAQTQIAEAYKERKEFFQDEEIQKVYDTFQKLKLQLEYEKVDSKRKALQTDIDYYASILAEYSKLKDNVEIHTKAFKDLKDKLITKVEGIKKDIDPINKDTELNTKKGIDNKLLEIMTGIMNNPHTQLSSVDTGNFDKLKELANEMRLLKIDPTSKALKKLKDTAVKLIKKKDSIELFSYRDQLSKLIKELETEDFNINYPSTQLEIFKRNMTGNKLIGPFANNNTNHAKALFTNLELAEGLSFDGEIFTALNQQYSIYGERISKSLAMKLAAVVDNAKEPLSSYLNLNMYTANLVALMSRLGIKEDTIFAFVNQPVIEELTQQYFNERGSVKADNERIAKLKKTWKAKLLEKTKKEPEELDYRDLNLENLIDALADRNTNNFYETQYKALEAFEEYFKTARELGEIVQATRIDTKGVGPTNGDNYVMLNRQEKIMSRESPRVLNANELLEETSDLKINPAFQKFGWLKPVSIMNKVFPAIGEISEDGRVQYSTLGEIKNFFSDQKGETYSITEKEARQVDSHFLSYLLTYSDFFSPTSGQSKEQGDVAFDILENTPDKLRKFKKNNPESKYNYFLSQLSTRNATKAVPFRHIHFHNTGRQDTDIEDFKRLWGEMMEDNNPEIKQLALDLVKYTFFTNGFNYGPFTFFSIIPLKFFTDDFALSNPGLGLIDKKGRTLNQGIEDALDSVKESGFNGDLSNRFIRQFAQATAAKSMIIPKLEKAIEANFIEGKLINKLAKDEVLVVLSGNEGTLNSGKQARVALDGQTSHDKTPREAGSKVKFSMYGNTTEEKVTNKVTEGNDGKGFLIPSYPEQINDKGEFVEAYSYFKKLKESSPEEYNKLRTEQLAKLKNSLSKLIETAKEQKTIKFLVPELNTPFQFSNIEIREILKNLGPIPSNIKLNKYFDVRLGNKPNFIKTKVGLALQIPRPSNLDLLRKGAFPTFVIVEVGKTNKLFSKIKNTDSVYINSEIKRGNTEELTSENYNVSYMEVPTTGLSNYILQYDINNPINQSLLGKISKEFNSEETIPEGLEFAGVPNIASEQSVDDEMRAAIEAMQSGDIPVMGAPTTQPQAKKATTKDTSDIKNELGMFDAATNERLMAQEVTEEVESEIPLVDPETLSTPTNLSYDVYVNKFTQAVKQGNEKFKDMLSEQEFNKHNPQVKETIIKCL